MQESNPYEPSKLASTLTRKRRDRVQLIFAAIGLTLLATAGLLFYFTERITLYTPYSTTTVWSASSLDDRYYTFEVPLQLKVAICCATIGATLLIIATLRRMFVRHIAE